MDVDEKQIGKLVIEGKTKQVFHLRNDSGLVYVLSKDRITAGDGVKAHEMQGKAKLSTQTNCAVFEFLSAVGIKTHFVSRVNGNDKAFVAKHCSMIPIEFVSRRVATGSFLRRHPHVKEGYRFAPPKLETFFKDDENHDPFWSTETLIEAKLKCGNLVIGEAHVEEMLTVTQLVFEVLERVWQSMNHALIDMKIEFGVLSDTNEIVVADVIDNDSWRLWPEGDKRLMLDKQVYRNMDSTKIDDKAIELVRSNFEIVAERTQRLFGSLLPRSLGSPTIGIVLGSKSDLSHAEKIKSTLDTKYGISDVEIHVCSAHKSTQYALKVISQLMQWPTTEVIIACAGRSNGLGPVAAANCTVPVINCPPMSDTSALQVDVWSSLRLPSGLGCATIIGAENAALTAAQIVANHSPFVWGKIRTQQVYTIVQMLHDDSKLKAH